MDPFPVRFGPRGPFLMGSICHGTPVQKMIKFPLL